MIARVGSECQLGETKVRECGGAAGRERRYWRGGGGGGGKSWDGQPFEGEEASESSVSTFDCSLGRRDRGWTNGVWTLGRKLRDQSHRATLRVQALCHLLIRQPANPRSYRQLSANHSPSAVQATAASSACVSRILHRGEQECGWTQPE